MKNATIRMKGQSVEKKDATLALVECWLSVSDICAIKGGEIYLSAFIA
jgi:hypothetical protein